MAFLSSSELAQIGFANIGENVLISDKASIYNPANISIGSNVRIDDFCVLSAGSGGIVIGDYVHIAVYALLIGQGRITLADFSGVSSRVSIYSSNDDYTGEYLSNPTVPNEFKNVAVRDVYVGRHVLIGSGSVVLPGAEIQDGAAIGSLSLVNKKCEAFKVYSGVPAKYLKERKRDLLKLELELLKRL